MARREEGVCRAQATDEQRRQRPVLQAAIRQDRRGEVLVLWPGTAQRLPARARITHVREKGSPTRPEWRFQPVRSKSAKMASAADPPIEQIGLESTRKMRPQLEPSRRMPLLWFPPF
jgi:hypothetical protein